MIPYLDYLDPTNIKDTQPDTVLNSIPRLSRKHITLDEKMIQQLVYHQNLKEVDPNLGWDKRRTHLGASRGPKSQGRKKN